MNHPGLREELYEENERPFDFKDTHFLGGYTYTLLRSRYEKAKPSQVMTTDHLDTRGLVESYRE